MEAIFRDLRHAVRRLLRSPGFTAIAALTLALGIGANVAIFTVVHAVLIRPLPFPDPDRLVRVTADVTTTGGRNIGISQPELDDLQHRAGIFEGVTALWPVSASFLGGAQPERIEVLVTSPNYFGKARLRSSGECTGRRTAFPDSRIRSSSATASGGGRLGPRVT